MPRKARIDASGALHHIIARGINRNTIFQDDFDRKNFTDRLATILNETKILKTPIFGMLTCNIQ